MKSRLTFSSWILSHPIAHRGLHNDTAMENSMPAYQLAIDKGFPIEMDVHMTRDNRLLCFHDDNTLRMTGVDGDVRQMYYSEAKSLRLKGTSQIIPDFEEFLELVDGKVPILIEIKNQIYNGIEKLVLKALENYKGEFAIQSFSPFIMNEVRKLNPDIIRGQLGTADAKEQDFKTRFALKFLPLNGMVKPDFISYNVDNLPLSIIARRRLPLISWTVRNRTDLSKAVTYANNYIFENFIPAREPYKRPEDKTTETTNTEEKPIDKETPQDAAKEQAN